MSNKKNGLGGNVIFFNSDLFDCFKVVKSTRFENFVNELIQY